MIMIFFRICFWANKIVFSYRIKAYWWLGIIYINKNKQNANM